MSDRNQSRKGLCLSTRLEPANGRGTAAKAKRSRHHDPPAKHPRPRPQLHRQSASQQIRHPLRHRLGRRLHRMQPPARPEKPLLHHNIPLAKMRMDYVVDPIADLLPVCPNCHVMLHRRQPVYSLEELKAILGEQTKS